MIEPLLDLSRLAAIAHRGGSKLRPENTLAAFDHGAALGADALECDVHLSRDEELVIVHDPTLDRTTDAGGPVGARTADELARVDAGFHFGPADGYPFRGRGHGVPRLRDLLVRHADRPIIVEIKGDRLRAAEKLLDLVREHDAAHRVIVGAFCHPVLMAVRQALPSLVTSASRDEARRALTRSRFRLAPRRPAYRLVQMPFQLNGRRIFSRPFVRAVRRAGLPVQAWIVDEPDDMRRLIDWGVTGIISDRPDVAVDVVRSQARCRSRPRPAAP